MKLRFKILAVFLATLMLMLPIVSCSDDEDSVPEPPQTDDEFEGFISQEGTQTPPEPTPPALNEGDKNATVNVSTYAELKEKLTQYGTFVLQNDIVIDDADFVPFGSHEHPFLGTFDGNGHKITVKATTSKEYVGPSLASSYVFGGLFTVTKDATIKGLTVDVDIAVASTKNYAFSVAGGIAGYMINTNVSECTVNGIITAQSEFFNGYAGGICGIIDGGQITGCTVNATLEVKPSQNRATCGGIVAYAMNNPVISGCTANGSVSATSTIGVAYAGGVVAHVTGACFTSCEANNTVYAEVTDYKAINSTFGAAFAGGIVAVAGGEHANNRVSFTRCYSLKNNVTVIGNNTPSYAGGIAALITYADFTHCYSLADVFLTSGINVCFAASGFGVINAVGTEIDNVFTPDFSIKGCFAFGNVTATHNKVMFCGAIFSYSYSLKNTSIEKVAYSSTASFTLNGKNIPDYSLEDTSLSYPKINPLELTLEKCESELGWIKAEWQVADGFFKAI